MAKLHESIVGVRPDRIDRDAGVIYGVKVIGLNSRNNRSYQESGLRGAVSLYEGTRVYMDHRDPKDKGGRRFEDHFGALRDARYVEGQGVFADLHYKLTHEQARKVVESAERFPEHFGLSHDADGVTRRDKGGRLIVESLTAVNSVDVVAAPATTNGLFESETMTMTTIKALVEATGYEHTAALLEALDGIDPMAEMPMPEVAPEVAGDPVEAVRAAMADEAMAVFLDPTIDPTETGKKVKALAQAVEDVAKKLAPAAVEEAPADAPAEEDAPAETNDQESLLKAIGELREEIAALKAAPQQKPKPAVSRLAESSDYKPAANLDEFVRRIKRP